MSAPHPLCVLYEIEYEKYCDAGCVWTRCLSRDQNSVSVLAFKNLPAQSWPISPVARHSDDNERAICSVDRVQNPNANTRGVPGGRSAACATNAVLACFGNSSEKLRFL